MPGAATSLLVSMSNLWQRFYDILFYTWPFVFVFVLFILRKKWKKYPIEAVIIEKRGENLIKTNDRLGKIDDKATGITYYQFAKTKETIPILDYRWILHNKEVPTNFLEKIAKFIRGSEGVAFLFKYGSKQYKPIGLDQKKKINEKPKFIPIKDKDGNDIYSYQYKSFDLRWVLGVLNFDVVDWDNINFMVQEQRASIERRTKKKDKLMMFIIPLTIIAASVVIGIFILKFSSDSGARLSVNSGGAGGSEGGGGSKLIGGLTDRFNPGE